MGELIFIGLGLHDEQGISIRGLNEVQRVDQIYIELYSSAMPNLSIESLERMLKRKVIQLKRTDLEENAHEVILKPAKNHRVALLVPGDPLVATTHLNLRVSAEKIGIKTRVIHGASIASAAPGLAGLQNYKFGRSVTIPFPEASHLSETPYDVIRENQRLGLHTLIFLDIRAEENRYMVLRDACEILLAIEKKRKEGVFTENTVAIGVARAGSDNPIVRAGYIRELVKFNFGGPPHTLIVPGKLHFMEAEALVTLAGAPRTVLGEKHDG
ncbi:diphthine synthase [Candidatus Bathyarchaeota archaeon]|nr:diphthine synthase [Candidatus Bathyarchaeota archaeon]